jgi:branched-chain amino acid transport system substrate-binding protein
MLQSKSGRKRAPVHRLALACLLALLLSPATRAQDLSIPVLVPLTGFLSLEGQSQRDGALLALRHPPPGIDVATRVADTGVSPEVAVNALEKALAERPLAIVASMLGTQMLAMMPLAAESKVPLVTISGTAKITELGNPWVFRFFPGDDVVKVAQARYAVEVLGRKRPAIIYQTTAYGQSGLQHLRSALAKLGAAPVFEEGIGVDVKDLLPVLAKAKGSGADVVALQLHAPSTALLIRQAASMGLGLPIVAGSAIHQPSTAALLEPRELAGVCAESASSPISGGSEALERWVAAYRAAFQAEPDAYALAQYDGAMMVLGAAAAGARTPEALRAALAATRYDGLAMTYKSDGRGNMAHSALVLCYDGTSRVPRIVQRYDNIDGVP